MLKVTVAEVRRDIVKQLGVDLSASMNYGTAAVVFQQYQSVHRQQCSARPRQWLGRGGFEQSWSAIGHRYPARDGERGRGADAGGAKSDGDLRRVRDIHFRRRISHSDRRNLPNDDGGRDRTMRPDGQFQEIRHLAQLHAGRADRGTDQPEGDDRSVGSLDRKRFAGRRRRNNDSLDQDASRGNHAGNSVRRLGRDGGTDPGANQAGHQRNAWRGPDTDFWTRCSGARTSSTIRPN